MKMELNDEVFVLVIMMMMESPYSAFSVEVRGLCFV
jgi:hypothetical protein